MADDAYDGSEKTAHRCIDQSGSSQSYSRLAGVEAETGCDVDKFEIDIVVAAGFVALLEFEELKETCLLLQMHFLPSSTCEAHSHLDHR